MLIKLFLIEKKKKKLDMATLKYLIFYLSQLFISKLDLANFTQILLSHKKKKSIIFNL